ncbi:BP74-related protein [Streptomyces sp. NPDC005004]
MRGGTLRRLLTRFGGLAVLDEAGGAFLPRGCWCPWTSRLTREVQAP